MMFRNEDGEWERAEDLVGTFVSGNAQLNREKDDALRLFCEIMAKPIRDDYTVLRGSVQEVAEV